MLEIIKKAALEAVGSGKPVAIQTGTVVGINPLEISLDQRLTLPEDFLIVPESLTRYEIDLSHVHKLNSLPDTENALMDKVVIREGLAMGDAVLMLRVQGGQKYVVLDKVVKA